MLNFRLLVFFSCLLITKAVAQESLNVDQAIAIALENNYDLKIAKNNTKLADVQTGILNSGYLPTVSASSGVNYSDENQNVLFLDQTSTSVDGAVTESYNASITAEYVIFDGLVRKFTNQNNEENLNLARLQERQQIENSIISIYDAYFNTAFQKQVVENLELNVSNSKDRLDRARRKLKYGQGTKLDELNAQVDLNNDSISFIEAQRDLKNLKRSLNLLLGRDVSTAFEVDTLVIFKPEMDKESLMESAQRESIQVLLANQNILLSDLDIKINRAQFLPKISGSGSYRWNESQNPPTSFALQNESYGINLGLNLSWNIFNGGNSTRVKTAKITKRNREIELIKAKEELVTDVLNSYETYSIAQFSLEAEADNLLTNELNFEKSKKQYGLGQITSVEYRQAQINLFNSRNNYARSKYDLKVAEINMLQLAGRLLE
ncbi:TolC family protein [Flagellimonas meridianipacifica]|uniref:Outer membrane protein TolC n=1 Tax=Flagellimonas meridianipacifica TaxID=1080225 RepID=A0A2T0MD12_9FLAO|nr:TolC family protein [Allomuricauda pacifica]PRX55391.1 outer membrane protein TolC [Allomuricauda pacifica]